MIFPDLKPQKWFELYPALAKHAERLCLKYGYDIDSIKPFITKKSAGFILNPHEEIPRTIHVLRNDNLYQDIENVLSALQAHNDRHI